MVRSFVLPLVLILVGVARPSWIALPYFIYSCGGLFHWAMTSNFVGLFWYIFIHQPIEVDILRAWGDLNKGIESYLMPCFLIIVRSCLVLSHYYTGSYYPLCTHHKMIKTFISV